MSFLAKGADEIAKDNGWEVETEPGGHWTRGYLRGDTSILVRMTDLRVTGLVITTNLNQSIPRANKHSELLRALEEQA